MAKKSARTPYIGFGNDTLARQPRIKSGDTINCSHCGGSHTVEAGTDSSGKPTELLTFYKCGEHVYLAGVAGAAVGGVKADCAGSI